MSEYNDCIFEGCMKPKHRAGYCGSHVAQVRRGEELRPLRGYTISRPLYCSFEDCDRGHFGNGYCEAHNHQHKKGMELRPIRKYAKRKPKTEKTEEQG